MKAYMIQPDVIERILNDFAVTRVLMQILFIIVFIGVCTYITDKIMDWRKK